MAAYAARRTLQALGVLFGVSIVVFAIVHLVPGDPIRLALGVRFDPDTYEMLRERSGLDQPLVVQYFDWIWSAIRGDLGVSFRTGEPVTAVLLERLPATMSLAFASLLLALLIAIPLGIIGAVRRGSVTDYVATFVSQIGISIPDFWMAIMLILLFPLTLGLLPPSGYVPLTEDPVGWLRHLLLPTVTLGVISGAIITRFVRSETLESLGQDYTRTARSKGLRERTVVMRHVVRNSLISVVTIVGLQLAFLLSGVIIVEVVFAFPGLGLLALEAVQTRDYPVLQGAVLLFAVFFLIVNLVVDLLYAYLDPRISYS
jgi:peptide/nickel transport system permease protein